MAIGGDAEIAEAEEMAEEEGLGIGMPVPLCAVRCAV